MRKKEWSRFHFLRERVGSDEQPLRLINTANGTSSINQSAVGEGRAFEQRHPPQPSPTLPPKAGFASMTWSSQSSGESAFIAVPTFSVRSASPVHEMRP